MVQPHHAVTLFDDFYEMMSDRVRLDAYRRAIEHVVRPGDVVIDLGAGLGILTFLALQCGAQRVYAIEKSDSIELARAIADKNGLSDKIIFLNQDSRDVQLDEKADVLISETLGSFGLDENTLAFTADVRDRMLKPGARLLPERIRCSLCPVETTADYAKVDFWREISGFDFSPALDQMLGNMRLVTLGPEQLMAPAQLFGQFELSTVQGEEISQAMRFQMHRPGTIHGLAGWFEVDLCEGVTISTAPEAPRTHWQQAFFPNREAIRVIAGDVMDVNFAILPQGLLSEHTRVRSDYRCTQLSDAKAQAPA